MKNLPRALTLFLLAGTVFADPRISHDLNGRSSNQPVDVIIQFKVPPSNNDLLQVGPFGQLRRQFRSMKAIHVRMPERFIQIFKLLPNVAYISPNRPMKGSLDVTTGTVAANLAWSSDYTGANVGVAVIDSGITSRDDF
ncbi:MAG: hypothetical protein LC126_08290, partial [Bryobacterales bacterium]|nr:hypothetical protein [Bryobacterales bacterium]